MMSRARLKLVVAVVTLAVGAVAIAGTGQTYYVGDASGNCGVVHYYGSSNGIGHRTTENAERKCGSTGCEDVWLNWSDGSGQVSGSSRGECNVPVGYLVLWQGDHSNPTAWCDGHPEWDYFSDASGRCEYRYVF